MGCVLTVESFVQSQAKTFFFFCLQMFAAFWKAPREFIYLQIQDIAALSRLRIRADDRLGLVFLIKMWRIIIDLIFLFFFFDFLMFFE